MIRQRSTFTFLTAVSLVFLVAFYPEGTGTSGQTAQKVTTIVGTQCTVSLKTGEKKKGKVESLSEEALVMKVKLSPFYSEEQKILLEDIEQVEDANGNVVSVESLTPAAKAEEPKVPPVKQETTKPPATPLTTADSKAIIEAAVKAALGEPTPPPSVAQSRLQPSPEPTTTVPSQAQKDKTETASVSPNQPPAAEGTKPIQSIAADRSLRTERPLRVVSAEPTTVPSERPYQTELRSSAAVPPSPQAQPAPQTTGTATTLNPFASKSTPTASAGQNQRASIPPRLAERPVVEKLPSGKTPTAKSSTVPMQLRQAEETPAPPSQASKMKAESEILTQAGVPASSISPEKEKPAITQKELLALRASIEGFNKTGRVITWGLGAVALSIIGLSLVLLLRRKSPAQPASRSLARPRPNRVVMVQGEYAVVDLGLNDGIGIGDTLMVGRQVGSEVHTIGVAKVVKVLDLLCGIKMVEKLGDTSARVGDLITRTTVEKKQTRPVASQDGALSRRRVRKNVFASPDGFDSIDDEEEFSADSAPTVVSEYDLTSSTSMVPHAQRRVMKREPAERE